VLRLEALAQRIERTGANVPVDDPEREKSEFCETAAARTSFEVSADLRDLKRFRPPGLLAALPSEFPQGRHPLQGRYPLGGKVRKKQTSLGACRLRLRRCNKEPEFHKEDSMKDLNERGLENQVKGTAKEMKGQIRGDLGDATDNASEHIKGRAEELKGKTQKNFGKAERDLDPDNV
jgi:uncharacterized protein YjbJ (UPF0337 family)